jgi:hypothetical protein
MCFCDHGKENSTLHKIIKSGNMRWSVHVSSMGQNRISSLGNKHATLTRNVGTPLLSDATSCPGRKESLRKPLSIPQNPYNNYLLKNGSAIYSKVCITCTHFTTGGWLLGFIWFVIEILSTHVLCISVCLFCVVCCLCS